MKFHSWQLSSSGRLIDVLRSRFPYVHSARALKRSLEENRCRINGRVERFASARVKRGDRIEYILGTRSTPVPAILHEDEQFLVLNKPDNTVCSNEGFSNLLHQKIFLVHRLDKETTGVLLLGKTKCVAEQLTLQFKERSVAKEYLALVDGVPKQSSGEITSHLVKKGTFQGQTIWGSSSQGGLWAQTTWKLLAEFGDRSLLLCQPKTGRTHQIRVHLAEMGHPILIDRQYAKQFRSPFFATRPLLHAWRLQVFWNGQKHCFEAPLPEEFHAHFDC
jgi:RluA family pseudouridine synthase